MRNSTKQFQKTFADEEHLRVLINNTDDPIWLVDADCMLLECNESFKKWVRCFIGFELDKGDLVLHNDLNKSYLDKFETCYNLALSGKSFNTVEDMQVGDETRYTTVAFNPVIDKYNAVVGVSCFARDITDRRRQLMRIEEQNAALREIAFIESHKVRGPVATILGLAQLFNNEDFADPTNKQIIEGITSMSHQLDAIIREVVKKSNEIDL